jgi:hypothetical protein
VILVAEDGGQNLLCVHFSCINISLQVGDYVLSVLAASDPLLDFGEKGGRKLI